MSSESIIKKVYKKAKKLFLNIISIVYKGSSDSKATSSHNNPTIYFYEFLRDNSIGINIYGAKIPRTKNHFDPLGEIWSHLRKKFRDYYEVDIVGTFDYINEEEIICNLYLNYGVLEENEDKEEYFDRFFNAFTLISHEFEETIIMFTRDERYGLDPYREMAEANFSPVIYEGMIKAFMDTLN